jgi:copper homeostasis protein CutC
MNSVVLRIDIDGRAMQEALDCFQVAGAAMYSGVGCRRMELCSERGNEGDTKSISVIVVISTSGKCKRKSTICGAPPRGAL